MENESKHLGTRRPYVISLSANAGPMDLDSYLSSLASDSQLSASSFVFRVTPELNKILGSNQGEPSRSDLLRRVSPDLPIQSITIEEGIIKLFRITREGLSEEPATEISRVQQADLQRLVEQYKDDCYYQRTSKYHYVAPSTEHCSAFFRLGDTIRSRDALDRLAFWLQPHISTSGAILVDTWSIAALILRAQQLQNVDIPFDCLASHPQQHRMEAEAVIKRLCHAMQQGVELTCVVSVTSSGRYGEIIKEICSRLHVKNVKCIAIYKLADASDNVDSLCQLDLKPDNYPPAKCPLCAKGSTAVTLHPGLYYLKDFPEKKLILGPSYFSSPPQPSQQSTKFSFLRLLREANRILNKFRPKRSSSGSKYDPLTFTASYHTLAGLLSVHKNDRHQRHHAFHIDVAKLLDHVQFQKKFNAKLDGLAIRPDVILTPSDDVSMRMGKMASKRLGCPCVAVDSLSRLEGLKDVERAQIHGRRHFLVLDDALVAGSRLSGLNTELRQRVDPPASVSFLVGLGRPTSAQEWRKHEIALTTRLTWPASLDSVEKFYLPNWDEKHCPWCREYEFLQLIAEPLLETPSWLKYRMARLTERERGVIDEPFWLLPGTTLPTLGHGSPVGPEGMSAIATVFAFAAALQRLRTDADRPLNPHHPDFQVFDARNLRNYSEGLLRASIFRVVQPKEWGVTPLDEATTAELLSAAHQPNQAVMLGELLLAIARRSFDSSLATSLSPMLGPEYSDVYTLLSKALDRI